MAESSVRGGRARADRRRAARRAADALEHESTNAWRARTDPCFEMRPWLAGPLPGPAHAPDPDRDSPRACAGRKAVNVADRGHKRRPRSTSTRTVISRRICTEASASRANSRSTAAISASRNSTWRIPASTVSRSSTGNPSRRASAGPRPRRSANGGRLTRQRINTAWITFDPRARPHRLPRRDNRRRITDVARSGTNRIEFPRRRHRANVRASSRSGLARADGSLYPPGLPPPPAPCAARRSARSPTHCRSPQAPPDHPDPSSREHSTA